MNEKVLRLAADMVRRLEVALEEASKKAEAAGDLETMNEIDRLTDAIAGVRQIWEVDLGISGGDDLDRLEGDDA